MHTTGLKILVKKTCDIMVTSKAPSLSKLDIYKEPEKAQFQATETEPTPLEENVSKVRKVVWKYSDKIKVGALHIFPLISSAGLGIGKENSCISCLEMVFE